MNYVLVLLTLVMVLPIFRPAHAQSDESKLPPTDYGAGYKLIVLNQSQESPPDANADPIDHAPDKFERTFPVISAPTTAETKAFDAAMLKMIASNGNGGTEDSDLSIDCEPVGLAAPVDSRVPTGLAMIPGVISAACRSYLYLHGAPHGYGSNWGFNWLVFQRREIRASDIFDTKTGWLAALNKSAKADQSAAGQTAGSSDPLNLADTSHWVVTTGGLGITYSWSEFAGEEDGGAGMLDAISWSKLAPFLRKDGIIPKSDWSAATPDINDLNQ
jgi:hypothetical protein